MSLDSSLQRVWYGPAWRAVLLWPLSLLFSAVTGLRRWAFRCGVLPSTRVSVPVIVIGNLTVGGTGKTPLVIYLANQLTQQGYRVGIITRGYGGQATHWPVKVTAESDADWVGDEAVLMASVTTAIVCAGPDRVAAAQLAIEQGAQVILSDDGLQHYRLARDFEVVVVDSTRGFGNGWLLPAGPLRESEQRLSQVDALLINQRPGAAKPLSLPTGTPCFHYRVELGVLHRLSDATQRPLSSLVGQAVHVVTGIGHPEALLSALRAAGLQPQAHLLPDHARFSAASIQFNDSLPVLMTGKDAVKCRAFADARHEWVEAQVVLSEAERLALLALLQRVLPAIH